MKSTDKNLSETELAYVKVMEKLLTPANSPDRMSIPVLNAYLLGHTHGIALGLGHAREESAGFAVGDRVVDSDGDAGIITGIDRCVLYDDDEIGKVNMSLEDLRPEACRDFDKVVEAFKGGIKAYARYIWESDK